MTDRPSQEPVDVPYDADYYTRLYGTEGPRPLSSHWWAVRWYAEMSARVLRRIGGRRVLEIGCGCGFLLGRLEQRYETYGVDLAAFAIGETRRFAPRSRCFMANIETGLPAEIEAGSFDLVIAKYVFEHLSDPLSALQTARSMLRPGGVLLYAVPNTASLGARVKGKDWYAALDPTHCSLLAPTEWRNLTRQAGLRIDRETADGWWDVPYFCGVPTVLQSCFFIGPTALSCLSGRAILPAGWGENLVFFACPAGA